MAKKIRPIPLATAVLSFSLALTSTLPAQQYLSDFENRIAKVKDEIKATRLKLDKETKKEATILSNLARLNLNRRILQKELAVQNIQIEKADAEIRHYQKNITETEALVESEKGRVEKILVTIHKFGRLDFGAFMLRAGNFDTVAAQTKRLSFLAKYEEKIIFDFNSKLSHLQEARHGLEIKKRELTEQLRLAEFKRRELEEETRKNNLLVKEIRGNKSTYAKTLEELQDNANRLQIMMEKIVSSEWVLTSPFVPVSEKRGRLPWPIEGKVISRFGPKIHPKFKTKIIDKGIIIAPSKTLTAVKSVHAGKVVYADYFYGYGNLLIIDHGLTYYSLYGHCSEFLAQPGDMVETGQKIAITGDTGSLDGECLYFEIRYKHQAQDPLKWLLRK